MQWVYFVLVIVPVHSFYSNFTEKTENLISTPCTDKNHFFLAPGVLTAGGTNRACISRFYPEGPAKMHLSLISEDRQTLTASRDLPPGDGGCLDISVPLLPNTKADLVVNIWYPEAKCSWERRVTLRIASGRVVVVHTERARHRAGETVRARVYSFKPDLTPNPGNVEEIWIEGPPGAWEGTRVAQWTKVRSKMGLVQVQHELDELAPPGRWSVRARLTDGSQGSAAFWVGNYELPPFQLTVRHSPKVLRTSERLAWTVCVRYPWTEAVEGMLVIRLRGAGSDSPGIRTAVRLRAPRACHRHAAAARRLGLGGDRPPDVLLADFSFQEEGTRVWQNTTVVSQVVDKPITLEFLTKHHTLISPALPYKLKVKATRWDDKPASNEKIRICRYSSQHNKSNDSQTCMIGDTDNRGVARLMFASEDDGSPLYRFEASLFNDSTTRTEPLTLATRRSPIQAVLGPLRADAKGTRTFVPLYLSLLNVTSPVTVHFVVITRGGIIYRWGATTQCPIASSATHIQTTSRNTKCNDPMAQTDDYNNQSENNNDQDKNNINRNESHKDKTSRSYNVNVNLYTNENHNTNPNKNNTRSMNENDINSYLHKNEASHLIQDKFSSIVIKPNVYDKVDDVNSIQHEMNASDSLMDRNLLRVMLPIKVTQQMCPDSHLIAYFYYNGEFVSATKHFEMDDCFVNKVEANFLSRQAQPGSLATLQISTTGPALCALTAIDSAAKWTHTYAVKDTLMQGLKKMIHSHRNITEIDAAGCYITEEDPKPPTNSIELASTWLAAAGVKTVADIPVKTHCDTPAALIDEGTVPRSDFSEAWLWRLVTVGANGTGQVTTQAPDSITRYEANAVCLSKTGVAISPPAVLQVFREFFIHADGPKRLRRGDSTIIRYRLFNYLYEPLSVQIQILTGPGLQGPANLVESVCIPPRASAARRVSITANTAGEGSITIRAKAVNDGGCGNNSNSKRGVSDEVIMKIVIEPEGIPVSEHKSMLLCGKDKVNSTSSQVTWSFSPATIVPGTETLTVWAAGDIIGPLLADADSLVLLPRGCGEQNMARLATNLMALSHLHPQSAAYLTAQQHVARGFTRQLQYIHPSGGFSAFGPSDVTSSTWLTAFSLRYMRRAQKILQPNQPVLLAIERAERWLLNQQMENGCFRNEGQVFHRELRGGMNEEGEIASVALTAYVITSLIEGTSPLPSHLVRNTLSCLRALPSLKYNRAVYAHSLLAYAFIRIKKYEEDLKRTNEATEDFRIAKPKSSTDRRNTVEASFLQSSGLKKHEGLLEVMNLIELATREGEFLWWETGSLSTSIEATSYALLALRESSSALQEFGSGAVRWLAAHRGPSGGFVSTQDTLVALEALSAWSSLQPTPANLTVTARSGSVTKVAKLEPSDRIPQVLKIGTGDQISIGVEGSGCSVVQATRSYHTLSSSRSQQQLAVELSVHTDGTFSCDSSGENCFCAAVIEACVVWSGSFPEMVLMEVTLPGGYGVDAARLYSQLHVSNTLVRRIELGPSKSRATLYLGPGAGVVPRRGRACVALHGVGPRAATRPAHVRVRDYYAPAVNDTQIYTIPEECPSRISHETTQDMTSDNIYNKARSMSNNGEILITHDFTFEDIPDGIPLEDPLYDNLTRKDKDIGNLVKNETNIDYSTITIDYNKTIENNYNKNERNYYIVNKFAKIDNSKPKESTPKWRNRFIPQSIVDPNDIYSPVFRSRLPFIPFNNEGSHAMKNVQLNIPNVIETNRILRQNRFNSDGKLDLRHRMGTGFKSNYTFGLDKVNDIEKLPFGSGDKQIDQYFERFKANNEIRTDTTTKNNLTLTIYDKQRSITTNTTTKEELRSNNIEKSNQENQISNHNIETRDEHNTNPKVENPTLSDFHVINSDKDLEVPSGIEGPIPAIVLPPKDFVPTISDQTPQNFAKLVNMPSNTVSRHSQYNRHSSFIILPPRNGFVDKYIPQPHRVPNKDSENNVPKDSIQNKFAPRNNAAVQNTQNQATRNVAPPNYTPNYFTPQYSPSFLAPPTNSAPPNLYYHPSILAPPNNFAAHNSAPNNLDQYNFPQLQPFMIPPATEYRKPDDNIRSTFVTEENEQNVMQNQYGRIR